MQQLPCFEHLPHARQQDNHFMIPPSPGPCKFPVTLHLFMPFSISPISAWAPKGPGSSVICNFILLDIL